MGEHKGLKVKDAKPIIRDELIKQGLAVAYSEPAGKVISRSGDECVVALKEQWYITYGEKEWRTQTEGYAHSILRIKVALRGTNGSCHPKKINLSFW